jgi:hypothetical protein
MKKYNKIVVLMLLLCFYTSSGYGVTKRNNSRQNSDYVWIVFNFNFSCEDNGKRKPEARVILKWGEREGRVQTTCYGRPDRNEKGFVIRLNKRGKPPLPQLSVFSAENCAASQVYQTEPPEENDPRYARLHNVNL